MVRSRFIAAWTFGATIILSAPFAQQLFTYVSAQWPAQSRPLGVAATAVPTVAVGLLALWRIRQRRLLRYIMSALGLGLGLIAIVGTDLTFTEAFHFAEYGVLAILFYRVWMERDDWSMVALPLLAGTLVSSADEWVQWFIPIRAGEMRDVLINVAATACGLLVAVALDAPARIRPTLERPSRSALVRWASATAVTFTLFFYSVHVGYDVQNPEIGSFRSNFTAEALAQAARDRAARWRGEPPVARRLLWREDHYLTEALWHVQQRDLAWERGDIVTAWRENRIVEQFFEPVLETTTYAAPAGHRWPPEQRADAAARVAGKMRPMATREFAVPLYVWPSPF
ncbi:MAG: VanZ family protein [Acidobacteria bacterium]|nr:VanZ family protein [Acidobacteriota bacterium]